MLYVPWTVVGGYSKYPAETENTELPSWSGAHVMSMLAVTAGAV